MQYSAAPKALNLNGLKDVFSPLKINKNGLKFNVVQQLFELLQKLVLYIYSTCVSTKGFFLTNLKMLKRQQNLIVAK